MIAEMPDLAALEGLARAATPGPWFADGQVDDMDDPTVTSKAFPPDDDGYHRYVAQTAYDGLSGTTGNSDADAAYIAAMDPPTTLALIAAVRRGEVDMELARLRGMESGVEAMRERVAAAEAERDALRAAVEGLAAGWEGWAATRSTPRIDAFRDAAEQLRAALAETPAGTDGDEREVRG